MGGEWRWEVGVQILANSRTTFLYLGRHAEFRQTLEDWAVVFSQIFVMSGTIAKICFLSPTNREDFRSGCFCLQAVVLC